MATTCSFCTHSQQINWLPGRGCSLTSMKPLVVLFSFFLENNYNKDHSNMISASSTMLTKKRKTVLLCVIWLKLESKEEKTKWSHIYLKDAEDIYTISVIILLVKYSYNTISTCPLRSGSHVSKSECRTAQTAKFRSKFLTYQKSSWPSEKWIVILIQCDPPSKCMWNNHWSDRKSARF